MQIFSNKDFYLGIDDAKYCDFSIHIGNLLLEYRCPSTKINVNRPLETGNERPDGEIATSNWTV